MSLEIREAGPVLYAAIRGDLDLTAAVRLYRELLREHGRTRSEAILIDCRGVRGVLSPVQRYDLGMQLFGGHLQTIEAGGVPPRIALIALPPLFDRGMLMESVAVNRGAQFRAVESLEAAAAWLEVDPASLAEC